MGDVVDSQDSQSCKMDACLGGSCERTCKWSMRALVQVVKKRVGVSVRKGDDIDLQGEGYTWQRVYPYQELLLLARVAGLKTVAEYGDMSLDVSLEDERAYRLVLCMQKAAT